MHEATPAIKLCECGCGEPAPISEYTDKRTGTVKGQPVRFALNHAHRGKSVSPETRAKLAEANSGEKNWLWRGDSVGYRQMHTWLCKHYPKTGVCDECRQPSARTEYALIHGRTYTRNREDYREMCRPCHMHYDFAGRVVGPETGAKISAAKKLWWQRQRDAGLAAELDATECPQGHKYDEANTYRDRDGYLGCRTCKNAKARANAVLKGVARGERSGVAKLTDAWVLEIRLKHSQGRTFTSLAREYGVSRGAVANVIHGRTWTHVLDPAA